jgi:hypothetical protein
VPLSVAVQVDYVARYLRGWRIECPSLPGLQGIRQVHELHPEPFGGMQVGANDSYGAAATCMTARLRFALPSGDARTQAAV